MRPRDFRSIVRDAVNRLQRGNTLIILAIIFVVAGIIIGPGGTRTAFWAGSVIAVVLQIAKISKPSQGPSRTSKPPRLEEFTGDGGKFFVGDFPDPDEAPRQLSDGAARRYQYDVLAETLVSHVLDQLGFSVVVTKGLRSSWNLALESGWGAQRRLDAVYLISAAFPSPQIAQLFTGEEMIFVEKLKEACISKAASRLQSEFERGEHVAAVGKVFPGLSDEQLANEVAARIHDLVKEGAFLLDFRIVGKDQLEETRRFCGGYKRIIGVDEKPVSIRCDASGYQSGFSYFQQFVFRDDGEVFFNKPQPEDGDYIHVPKDGELWITDSRRTLGLQCWDIEVPSDVLMRPSFMSVKDISDKLRRRTRGRYHCSLPSSEALGASILPHRAAGEVKFWLGDDRFESMKVVVSKAHLSFLSTGREPATGTGEEWKPCKLERELINKVCRGDPRFIGDDEAPVHFTHVSNESLSLLETDAGRLILREGNFRLFLGRRNAGEETRKWYIEPISDSVPVFILPEEGATEAALTDLSAFTRISSKTRIDTEHTRIATKLSEDGEGALFFSLDTGSPPPPSDEKATSDRPAFAYETDEAQRRALAMFLKRLGPHEILTAEDPTSQCVAVRLRSAGGEFWAKLYAEPYTRPMLRCMRLLGVEPDLDRIQQMLSRASNSFEGFVPIDTVGNPNRDFVYVVVVQRNTVLLSCSERDRVLDRAVQVGRRVRDTFARGVAITDLTPPNFGQLPDGSVHLIDTPALWPVNEIRKSLSEPDQFDLGTKRREIPLPEELEGELRGVDPDPEAIQVYLLSVLLAKLLSGRTNFLAYDRRGALAAGPSGMGRDRYDNSVSVRIKESIQLKVFSSGDVFQSAGAFDQAVQLLCDGLAFNPHDRPRIHDVVERLEGITAVAQGS